MPYYTSYLAPMCRDNTQVSWDSVSTFDLHQITSDYLLCIDALLFPITHNQGLLHYQNKFQLTYNVSYDYIFNRTSVHFCT